jgi:hypothetical protein
MVMSGDGGGDQHHLEYAVLELLGATSALGEGGGLALVGEME